MTYLPSWCIFCRVDTSVYAFYVPADRNVCFVFVLESVTSFAMWRGVVVSRRCTNVWLGRLVVYVCQQNRERGEEGGGALYGTTGPGWNMRAGDPRSPFPVSALSASCLVISALLKHPMKALPQINVCASLFFTGLKWLTLSARPSPSFPFLFFLLHSRVCFEMPQEKLQPLVYITVP